MSTSTEPSTETYALGIASRITGISPDLLRAWERRHGAVTPRRTPGGTRRYTSDDLRRLRSIKAAVDAGHRIGEVARLDDAELERLANADPVANDERIAEVLAALARLDPVETRRLLAVNFATLGPQCFARDFAFPLVEEIGRRWSEEQLGIAAEHLASSLLSDMLGAALQPNASAASGPRMVFATMPGERHALGLQMAALTAMGAGANPVYLGPDVPCDDLIAAMRTTGADVLALAVVTQSPEEASRSLRTLRAALPRRCQVWLGGRGAAEVPRIEGVRAIDGLDTLAHRVQAFRHSPYAEEHRG